MYSWTCPECGREFEAESEAIVQEQGKEHLLTDEYDELEERFREEYAGEACRHCSRPFPSDPAEHPGFECGQCEHNHEDWFAVHIVDRTLEEA